MPSGRLDGPLTGTDGCAATENIFLAATALGPGGCRVAGDKKRRADVCSIAATTARCSPRGGRRRQGAHGVGINIVGFVAAESV